MHWPLSFVLAMCQVPIASLTSEAHHASLQDKVAVADTTGCNRRCRHNHFFNVTVSGNLVACKKCLCQKATCHIRAPLQAIQALNPFLPNTISCNAVSVAMTYHYTMSWHEALSSVVSGAQVCAASFFNFRGCSFSITASALPASSFCAQTFPLSCFGDLMYST